MHRSIKEATVSVSTTRAMTCYGRTWPTSLRLPTASYKAQNAWRCHRRMRRSDLNDRGGPVHRPPDVLYTEIISFP